MSDRLSKAVEELKKMPLYKTRGWSRGSGLTQVPATRPNMTNVNFHDRFTEAVMEEGERSAFACQRCRRPLKQVNRKFH
ncbi:MAG: hypothetical protein JRE16_04555 [Deltaproteobacteria bacterium]|jgi:hypothetical protein|nr:hypothetical protein [Deltaproteobacteria bacterium]MBW2503824.1 hypothetical protein [Deltaproteobacteria bacterium]